MAVPGVKRAGQLPKKKSHYHEKFNCDQFYFITALLGTYDNVEAI